MIKLDNKGFAVSTILYGILSITIIILMLIFATLKSSHDINVDLVTSVEDRLNKCVDGEVNLEYCYSDSSSCNTNEFDACK